MVSKTYCTIIEDGKLYVSGSSEPCFEKEATLLFSAKINGGRLVIEKEHKDALIDLARDYFYEIVYDGDTRERVRGKHWKDGKFIHWT